MTSRPARPANVRACAVVSAALLATTGCGGGERQDADAAGSDGPYTLDIEGPRFPASQRIAQRSTFVISVRNAGDTTIPDLAVTLRGFARVQANSSNADPRVSLWTIDQAPPGTTTAIADTWAAGALKPGERATLRWQVTPIVAGTHELRYSVAPSLQSSAPPRVAGGRAASGTLTVDVDARPAFARVDPRTGHVIREE